ARRAGQESIILLKNHQARLPLRRDLESMLVVGPLAHDNGAWWSRYGAQRLDFVTPLEGLRARLGDQVTIRHVKGVDAKDEHWPMSDVLKEPPSEQVKHGIREAVEAAAEVDVIIAVMGETDELCRESASRISLELPGYQQELLEALHATGRPVVLVLSSGRPLAVNWADRHIDAIVQMWFPGEDGGHALADVLLGDYNPAGRLPVTVPRSVGQIPYNFPARPGSQARDYGQVEGPLYPFGYGLSYTTFRYDQLHLSAETIGASDRVTVSCRITNVGTRAGDEVVQLYVRDDYTSVVNFDQQLRGFTRLHLQPGESRTVEFTLKPEHLALFDANGQWRVEPGRFTVMVGASSSDIRLHRGLLVTNREGQAPEEAPLADDWLDGR
ncbi:MAG TPA: glycoside hydrolase family 3 C-terminal domain-containing protein, partial [Candidatus Synoicihabitans sp.]|nr:glycoside hydrolase family 3 C-terminal domain-containing protein [Candidatus Synoicihabitans sp.]